MAKKWTHDPPCEAELFLEGLFEEKKIGEFDQPGKIQSKYTIFKPFSPSVFRNNFKRIREKNGVGLSKYINMIFFLLHIYKTYVNYLYCKIVLVKFCENDNAEEENITDDKMPMFNFKTNERRHLVETENEPMLMTMYQHPGSLDAFVLILMPIVSGAMNVKFSLSDDGKYGFVKYDWPHTMSLDITKIFKKENEANYIFKTLAIEAELSKFRQNMMDIPKAVIKIKLPCVVQTSSCDQKVIGFEGKDGCKLLRIEIPAHKKSYARSETIVKFEK